MQNYLKNMFRKKGISLCIAQANFFVEKNISVLLSSGQYPEDFFVGFLDVYLQ